MTQKSTDTFRWVGSTDSSWSDVANWIDVTAGNVPATIVPNERSVIAGAGTVAIQGTGAAKRLAAGFTGTLDGMFSIGTIAIGANGETGALTISGGTVTTQAITGGVLGGITVFDPGAELIDAGAAAVAASITAFGQGLVVLQAPLSGAVLEVDGSGAIVFGMAAQAAAYAASGNVVVAAGATLAGSGTISAGYVSAGGFVTDTGTLDVYGTVLASNLFVKSYVGGTGTIEVVAGGTFSDPLFGLAPDNGPNDPGAELTFKVDAGGLLQLAPFSAQPTIIDLAGAGAAVAYEERSSLGYYFGATTIRGLAPINGFVAGDSVLVGLTVAGGLANFTLTTGNPYETIDLRDGAGGYAGYLVLASSYGAGRYELTKVADYSQDLQYLYQLNLKEAGSFGISEGLGGHVLTWSGPTGFDWGDKANWIDETQGGAMAAAAPGAADTVEIAGGTGQVFTVLAGPGSAVALDLSGNVALVGAMTVGRISLAAASLVVSPGGSLRASSLDGTGGVSVIGNVLNAIGAAGGTKFRTASMTVSGNATLGDGNIFVSVDSTLRFGNLTLTGSVAIERVGPIDGLATNEAAAAVTDKSSIVIGGGAALPGDVSVSAGATLDAAGGNVAIYTPIVRNNGLILAADLTCQSVLSGTGSVIIAAGGIMDVTGGLAAGSKQQITLDSAAALSLGGTVVPAGSGFSLAGSNDVLNLGVSGAGLFMVAPIVGLAFGDQVNLGGGGAATAAIWSQTATDAGVLSLRDATGAKIGNLDLVGKFAGANFLTANGTVLLGEAKAFPVSNGTAGADQFVWTGISGGAWGDRANWQDTTVGGKAAVAPGSNDVVSITDTATTPLFVIGTGNAAELDVAGAGPVYLDGTFATGAVGGPVTSLIDLSVLAGATLTASAFGMPAVDEQVRISGKGALLDVTGTLTWGSLLNIIPFSGNGFYVGAGATMAVGALSGAVTLNLQGDATLRLPSVVAAGADIVLAGSGNTVVFGAPHGAAPSIASAVAGIAAGDVVDLASVRFDAGKMSVSPASAALDVFDNGTAVAAVPYAAAAGVGFSVTADGHGGTSIVATTSAAVLGGASVVLADVAVQQWLVPDVTL